MMSAAAIGVLLVDDHQMFVDSLLRLFGEQADFDVVGTATSQAQRLEQTAKHHPDIAIVDYELPGGYGTGLARAIREHSLRTRVLMITGDPTLARLRDAIDADCVGFLAKDCGADDLLRVVRLCAAGGSVIEVPDLRPTIDSSPDEARHQSLTLREREVLRFLASGTDTKTIATRMYLSVHTVHSDLHRMYAKLGAKSRLEAVALAHGNGLL